MIYKEIEIGKHICWMTERGWYCDCEYGLVHYDQWESGKALCKHLKIILNKLREERNNTFPLPKGRGIQ